MIVVALRGIAEAAVVTVAVVGGGSIAAASAFAASCIKEAYAGASLSA